MLASDADLVDQIYAAALLPDLWTSVIDAMSDRVGGRGGSIFVLSDGTLSWEAPEATRLIMEAYVAGDWGKHNIRLERLLAAAHPGFVGDRELMVGEDIETLPIYRDFLLPHDVAFTAATVVAGASGDLSVFSIDRRLSAGHFGPRELAWLNGLRPHLARSVALAGRLKLKQASTVTATLQLLRIPAAVLSGKSTVLASNPLFESLAGGAFLPAAGGRLRLRDVRADRLLGEALEESGFARTVVRSIPIAGEAGLPVGILHVVPARREARDILGDGCTLLALAQPHAGEAMEADWLRWLYDLSPAEAKVASRLAVGQTIEEIALAAGNSLETVRTHVKRVLQKTGFKRQIDFVRHVGGLSILRPAAARIDR